MSGDKREPGKTPPSTKHDEKADDTVATDEQRQVGGVVERLVSIWETSTVDYAFNELGYNEISEFLNIHFFRGTRFYFSLVP